MNDNSIANITSLLLAVVEHEDADASMRALSREGISCVRISSTGGFLQKGNTTLLAVLQQGDAAHAVNLLKANCRTRMAFVTAEPSVPAVGVSYYVAPIEVELGGATTFVLPVERVVQLGEEEKSVSQQDTDVEASSMKLVVVITRSEEADILLDTFRARGYRATLISSTGGFFHGGNSTLLIGVKSALLEHLLSLIRGVKHSLNDKESSRAKTRVFVLDVEHYERV